MTILIAGLLLIILGVSIFMHTPKFGKNPSGEDLERVMQSPNYRDGQFQNQVPTPAMAEGESAYTYLRDVIFKKIESRTPDHALPTQKTNLKELNPEENLLVWMGHGSYYLQIDGKRILIDPVLVAASPVTFFGGAFEGTDIYEVSDMPRVDYLLITHDHWDHLDYDTVKELKHEELTVICPLGVGSHFRHWRWNDSQIVELDWQEKYQLGESLLLHALPARHFSGRGFARNKTLWASFMLQSSLGNIYLSGDGGYSPHVKQIKKQFGDIRFAVLENGQYDRKWANIHFTPDKIRQAIADLQPQEFITIHNSKYALAQHDWHEPLENVLPYANFDSTRLLLPLIGEVVHIGGENRLGEAWWRERITN
ncbi:MAG: MBL fold metallo-hydrolase [Mangrovibacterium sp.]